MTRRLPTYGASSSDGVPAAAAATSTHPQQAAKEPSSPRARQWASASKKTFIVTGANRGIGLGLAKALSKHGNVIATARDPSSADDLKAIPNVQVVALDVTSPASVAAFAAEVQKLAPHGIDLLWNNAGRNAAKFEVTDKIDADSWVEELTVNSVGPTLVTNAVLPLLRKANEMKQSQSAGSWESKVVFTSSNCGSIASNPGEGNMCAYFSSKAALNQSIKFWHYQLVKEGFCVTPIHPGWVQTDMGGPDGALTVEESVSGMMKVISALNVKSELKLRVWDGSTLPW